MSAARCACTLIVAGVIASFATTAQAVRLEFTGATMVATESYGCVSGPAVCSLAVQDHALQSSEIYPSGRIDVNPDPFGRPGWQVIVSLTLRRGFFDGSWGLITFRDVIQGATFENISMTPIGPGAGSIVSATIGTGWANGFVNDLHFDDHTLLTNLSCNFPGGTGQCRISFGEPGFTNVYGSDWRWTYDLTVQPQVVAEPSAALLLALGFAGIVSRTRVR